MPLDDVGVTTYRYRSQRSDEPLRTTLVELAQEKPRFGYRRLYALSRRSGEQMNQPQYLQISMKSHGSHA